MLFIFTDPNQYRLINIMIKQLTPLSLAFIASFTWAETPSIKPINNPIDAKEEAFLHITNQDDREFSYTRQELEDNPQFTGKLLEVALSNNNQQLVEKLLSAYAQAENNDAVLVDYAKAKLAKSKDDYPTAIKHYKNILSSNPELDQIRLELALALFRDQQNINAKNQFNKLKSSEKISPQIQQLIDSYLEALEQRNEWDISGSINYIRESNINNVSDSLYVGSWKKPKSHLPQSANGVEYSFGINKDFNLKNKHYLAFENYTNGERYWDNDAYDDLTSRTYLGYRYKSADTIFSLLPFYKKNWSADSDYNNHSIGIKTGVYHKINPNFSYSVSANYNKNYYPKDNDFNGYNKGLSSTLYWQRNPRQSFYIGGGRHDKNTNIKRFDSVSKSLHTGWNQEWNRGVSSRLGLGYTQTEYGDMAKYGGLIPLGKARKDNIYTSNVILWKRDWQLFGITPKLNISYKKQISNLPDVYSYDKTNANIVFEKSF
ncbi:MAG: hypothetical protein CR966_00635 [Pseudomonadales bacterium]|nr:MAG: hypothetical protein CR966_00635 [Pseudomonadales bacterium]